MLLTFKILLVLAIIVFAMGTIASEKKDERTSFTAILCTAILALCFTFTI